MAVKHTARKTRHPRANRRAEIQDFQFEVIAPEEAPQQQFFEYILYMLVLAGAVLLAYMSGLFGGVSGFTNYTKSPFMNYPMTPGPN
jgi:hypothetical protein